MTKRTHSAPRSYSSRQRRRRARAVRRRAVGAQRLASFRPRYCPRRVRARLSDHRASDNPSTGLSRDFLIDAFLKRSTRWNDGQTIRPVDQRPDSPARRRFSNNVLQRSVAGSEELLAAAHLFPAGSLPPPELDSDEAVLRLCDEAPRRSGLRLGSREARKGQARPGPMTRWSVNRSLRGRLFLIVGTAAMALLICSSVAR